MCGRYTLKTPVERLSAQFQFPKVIPLKPRYNIAPSQDVAVVRHLPGDTERVIPIAYRLEPSNLLGNDSAERIQRHRADAPRPANHPSPLEGEGRVRGELLHLGTNWWDIHRRLCGHGGFPPLSAGWTTESIETGGSLQSGRDSVVPHQAPFLVISVRRPAVHLAHDPCFFSLITCTPALVSALVNLSASSGVTMTCLVKTPFLLFIRNVACPKRFLKL